MLDYFILTDLQLHKEIDLTTYGVFVRLYRLSIQYSKNGSFYYSQERICNELEISKPTLIKSIKKLIQLGFVSMRSGNRPKGHFNNYSICLENIREWHDEYKKSKSKKKDIQTDEINLKNDNDMNVQEFTEKREQFINECYDNFNNLKQVILETDEHEVLLTAIEQLGELNKKFINSIYTSETQDGEDIVQWKNDITDFKKSNQQQIMRFGSVTRKQTPNNEHIKETYDKRQFDIVCGLIDSGKYTVDYFLGQFSKKSEYSGILNALKIKYHKIAA